MRPAQCLIIKKTFVQNKLSALKLVEEANERSAVLIDEGDLIRSITANIYIYMYIKISLLFFHCVKHVIIKVYKPCEICRH